MSLDIGIKTKRECILVIDDYVDIAKELELDGVHLGKNDMNPIEARNILGGKPIIGVTANSYEDIECYSCVDIDYIGLGPYRFTTTKKNLSPILGIDKYKNIDVNSQSHHRPHFITEHPKNMSQYDTAIDKKI